MITILCSGSRGDIQPYICLAVELQKLGKDVRIAAGNSFASFIKSYGVKHYPLSLDYKTVGLDPKIMESAQNSTNPLKMLLTFNKMKKYARFMVDEMYEACRSSELIVWHPGCTIGYFAALEMGIPSVLAAPFPLHETKEVASVIAYGKTKLPFKTTYKLLQGMLWMASKSGVAAYYREKKGSLPPNFGCPFERVDSRHPAIVSCSNFVFKRPGDWNSNIHQYGFWFIGEETDYTPPAELADFLLNGKKPVYFGFGSVFNENDIDKFLEIIIASLAATGERGIVSGMGIPKNLPENIFAIDDIPHKWLFPRCGAVCHHGGAGTSAAGFASGVPNIIIPFSNDQFAWAHRAYDIGVGAKPIYKKQLSSESLTAAIRFALSDKIKTNAVILGRNMASENGAKNCALVIAEILR